MSDQNLVTLPLLDTMITDSYRSIVAFHPRLPLIVTSYENNNAKIWEISTNGTKTLATGVLILEGHREAVNSIAFHPRISLIATGSDDYSAKLWLLIKDDPGILRMIKSGTLNGHKDEINCVAFDPLGQYLATSSNDNTVKLWSFPTRDDTTKKISCVATLKGHMGYVSSVAFHPILPILATGSGDRTVKLWKISDDGTGGDCLATLGSWVESKTVNSVAFHPVEPLIVIGHSDGTVKVWTISQQGRSASCLTTLKGHRSNVYSVAFHPNGQFFATASLDMTVKLWLLRNDNSSALCVSTFQLNSAVKSVVFDPSGRFLATGCNSVQLWDCSLLTNEGRRSELLATSKFAQVAAEKIGVNSDFQKNILRRVMSQKNQALAVSLLTDEQSQEKSLAEIKKKAKQNGGKISRRKHKNRNNIQGIRKSRK